MANNNIPYMTIPPPPLPEFYLPRKETPSTPSTDGGAEVEYSIRYERRSEVAQGTAMPGDGMDERLNFAHSRITEASLPQSVKSGSDVPPLAIYHICRVCLRPRSARYHQEHPIPEDGLPPPPGICRRCRVTPAEETRKVTQIVEEHDSNDIQLGIRAFIPDGAYYSNQEMREKRAEYLLRNAEWQEVEPPPRHAAVKDTREHSYKHTRVNVAPPPSSVDDQPETQQKEYIYRHVHVALPPPPPPQTQPVQPKHTEYVHRHIHVGVPPPPVTTLPKLKKGSDFTAQDVIDSAARKSTKSKVKTKEVDNQYGPWAGLPPPPPMVSAGAQETTTRINVHETATRERKASITSNQKATSQHSSAHKTVPSEAEIRRLARDEVVRYRQAERKLEAHSDPYAHGKMVPMERVPVERRIETVRDVVEEKPWARPREPSRRDSGVAIKEHVRAREHKQEKQEVVVVRESRQESRNFDTRQQRAASPSPPSSASSAKDAGPRRPVERPVRRSEAVSEVQGVALDSSGRQVGPRFGIRKIDVPGRKHDIVEFSEHWDEDEKATETRYVPVRKDDHWATELAQDFDRVARAPSYVEKPESMVSKWTSQDYWNEEETAKTAITQSTRKSSLKVGKPSNGQQDERGRPAPPKDGPQTTIREEQTVSYERHPKGPDRRTVASEVSSRQQDLPYPREDEMPISMPSPTSHMSNLDGSRPRQTAPRDGDKEWIYVRRTVQPADRPWDENVFDDDQRSDLDFKETTERFTHRKAPQDDSKTITPPSKRRTSDVSSRVRFSSKLDVSPTPPDSDASSSEFRRSGLMKHHHDGPVSNTRSVAAIEQADRGRSRSRTANRREQGYYYERDTIRTREREYHEADRDRTPKPSDRGRRRSGTDETATGLSTMPSGIRPLARAFSESPSREALRDAARRQKLQQKPDSNGPYTVEHNRSDSVEAFDGSTVTISSRGSVERERRVPRRDGGRGGRR